MNQIPPFSPGCFGSALAYQDDGSVCRVCPFREECKPMHERNLAALREQLGVTVKRGPKPKPAADPTVSPGMELPLKVRKLVDRLDQLNLNIVENLKAGINPFKGHNRFLEVAAHLLLHRQRPVERAFLSAAFVKSFGWSKETADAHARMSFQALVHVGAIVEDEAGAIIRRE